MFDEGKGIPRSVRGSSSALHVVLLILQINTLWTGDADLRLYITTVQDG